MKVLLIDNYDSFTYNLVHYLEQLDVEVRVLRNDSPELNGIQCSNYNGLVLSPGPGLPKESGQLMTIIEKAFGTLPILGVCLGMQALAEHTGGTLYNRDGVMHGRTAILQRKSESILLQNITDLQVGLYHSWAVRPESLKGWTLCAVALEDHVPMVMENTAAQAYAVQFHPESVLTPQGLDMIRNWVNLLD